MAEPGAAPDVRDGLVPRATRVPVHVPVRTEPPLSDAWTANVSSTGIAVTMHSDRKVALTLGQKVRLEFQLPGASRPSEVSAAVQSIAPMAHGAGAALAVGLSFVELRPAEKAVLERFVHDYRPMVAAYCPTPADNVLCRLALEEHALVTPVAEVEELRRLLEGGEVSVVVLFCWNAAQLSLALRALEGASPVGAVALGLPLEVRRPRVVCVTDLDAAAVLSLHNEGLVHHSAIGRVKAAQLRAMVLRACDEHDRESELARYAQSFGRQRRTARPAPPLGEHLGPAPRSMAMQKTHALAVNAAGHTVPVLLTGDTGTGKEVLARYIHQASPRASGPFVALDCGALTETLLESELFGHVKGAFTGATEDRPGLFRAADGGTLLLDEIENMPQGLQTRLLRVLEAGEVRPVGGTRSYRVDARLIGATNRNIWAEVEAGRFRADLYYRLNRFPIRLPSLTERSEDILPLASFFLERFAGELRRAAPELTAEARSLLVRHGWPGNLRELRNALERALLLWDGASALSSELLVPALSPTAAGHVTAGGLDEQLQAFERQVIERALGENDGVLRRTARALGTSPATLSRRARALAIRTKKQTPSDG